MSRRVLFSVLVYILVIIGLAALLQTYYSDLKALFSRVDMWDFVIISLLQCPIIVLLIWPSVYLIRQHGYYVSFRDIFLLAHVCNMFNSILPYRPGIGIRWLFLKHHYKVPTMVFIINSVCFYSFLLLFTLIVFILMGMHLDLPERFYASSKSPYVTAVLAMLGILFVGTVARKVKNKNLIVQYIQKVSQKKLSLLIFLVTTSSNIFLMAFALYLAFAALGQTLYPGACLWLICGLVLSSTVHVTPGNIGISEFVVGSLTEYMFHDFSLGLAAFLIFRVTQMTTAFIIGLPSIHYIVNGDRKAIFERPSIEDAGQSS